MAADLDFEVATLAVWGFVDQSIKTNERYLYIVEINEQNKSNNSIKKGEALVFENKKEELPKPLDFIGIFQDQSVILSWEYLQLRDIYTSYFIERSDDGNNFYSLSNLPVMNMNSESQREAHNMIFIDSLKTVEKDYSYRIRGKTIFGDFGPYLSIASGKSRKKLGVTLRISQVKIENDNKIILNWEFPLENKKK